jgi:BirA family biotin operon repressor/biotin-[acetyl-CoA-carboxylase] ligase
LTAGPEYRVRHFDRIDSTNAEARRAVEAGEHGPLWFTAGEQTAGRGRLGRHWVSKPGNLYATLLLPLSAPIAMASQVGFVASLAVHDVVAAALPNAATLIKWPNDVQVRGAKIAGILAEVVSAAPLMVALGCGINVAHAPDGTPYRATSLAAEGASLTVDEVFARLGQGLRRRLEQWDEGRSFAAIRADWLARAAGLGAGIAVSSPGGDWQGLFRGLAEDGALLVERRDGTTAAVHAGDIRIATADFHRKDAS